MKGQCPLYSWMVLNQRWLDQGRINAAKVVLNTSFKASALVPRAEFHSLRPWVKNVFFSGWAKTSLGAWRRTFWKQYISGLGPGQLKALFTLESGYSAKSSAGLKGLIRVHERNFGPSADAKFWVHEHGRLSWLQKIIRPVLPMRKHSRAAPEPLGWRKRPWPFPPAGSSRAESATTVMFSCKPAGSLLGRPQAGAYVNSFPFQTHTPCSTAVDCPPLQAGTWGSSAECPCPFSSLSNLSAYTAPPPPTSNTPHIWRPSLPSLSIFQPSAGAGETVPLLYLLPGWVWCIEGTQGYPSAVWFEGCTHVCRKPV